MTNFSHGPTIIVILLLGTTAYGQCEYFTCDSKETLTTTSTTLQIHIRDVRSYVRVYVCV